MNTKRDEQNNAKPLYRTAYNYDKKQASMATALITPEPTRTQQHQRDDADINVIVQRFNVTGVLPQGHKLPQYGDFTGPTDYQECLNKVIEAQDAFDSLPAKARQHFKHDPARFLEFLEAGPSAQLLLDLGLATQVSPAREKKADPVPPTPAPPA